ncbi:Clp protease [Nonomuraea sp. WAC 01424]|uniref:Clp protease N-terminal domain-containing protein n=1 Tax=Nonomuraea sp. WAC 01424 TaxID=2203200 RepID=UPI000F7AB527|nr:Clp protease N-terminal domain-containing protein [Nonomuraea sp. WAC 01424]RSN05874.1 Clp protease [Nonomuraea sp. WAC 01424]
MSGTFDKYLHEVLVRPQEEARAESSATIEAHHVLLAMTASEDTAARPVLAAAGLDHAGVREALRREFEHSLAAAGVSADVFDLRSTPDPERRPQLGASVKLAIERLAGAHRKKDLRPIHVLLGVLQAEVGTVPRALALAGVDRTALAERARATL